MCKIIIYSSFLISTLLSVVLLSCKSDKPVLPIIVASDLVGNWKVIEAYKSGKKTSLLDNGYFKIDTNNRFSTNILADTSYYPFILKNEVISVNSKDRYHVIAKTSDTLIMDANLRNFNFRFVTVKD